ncbi:hypothetical protein CY34DRAFT_727424 [Suillus luteus UH-Slu-Lm8-n1]|uniref:Secreted protein n=1 Tax=Suillus luteus UH-Slu-Lm8-n1 TaxID=930992 RepID=A0A0D0B9U7_9AGAM|nr:hypothetical protein CY34DRAFT_727424 [Suillus luteus UH-Slu-Lm8-n1]
MSRAVIFTHALVRMLIWSMAIIQTNLLPASPQHMPCEFSPCFDQGDISLSNHRAFTSTGLKILFCPDALGTDWILMKIFSNRYQDSTSISASPDPLSKTTRCFSWNPPRIFCSGSTLKF